MTINSAHGHTDNSKTMDDGLGKSNSEIIS